MVDHSLLVVAGFSRHAAALDWAVDQLTRHYGPISSVSVDFDFHHTRYYEKTMGTSLLKRFMVFTPFVAQDCLPDVKNRTIALEQQLIQTGLYPEPRPLNLDPGLLQLGKFLLATTKNQAHRIYLRDGIYAEVTLRFHAGGFDLWPWTYADYQEPEVRRFLAEARQKLYERILLLRQEQTENPPSVS